MEKHPKPGYKISEVYTIGEELGKGGFGTVFMCRNSETGETVAVKRISIRNMNPENIKIFEVEISLLKKLDHPNIVKYIGTVRTADHLNIVLEYMENGSLAQNVKLFGVLPQSLCSLYVRQILQGLKYLHEQGVIHRDIKGANILTTKNGLVKLADFGVATHSSSESNEVVGTPYWMAPEIIEMSGPTTACDIWSVGCTIIEVLTLKPPYFDIPPMAALYRIVQDDHPPLPEDVSPALREFLLLCFKKEPLLRSSADDLLRHRWVDKVRQVKEPTFVMTEEAVDDEDEHVVRQELKTISNPSESPVISVRRGSRAEAGDPSDSIKVSDKQRSLWRKSVMNTIRLSEAQRIAGLRTAQKDADSKKKRPKGKPDEEDTENWDEWDTNNLRAAVRRSTHIQEQIRPKEPMKKESTEDDEDEDFGFDEEEESDHGKAIQAQLRAMIGSNSNNNITQKNQPVGLNVGDIDLDDLDGAFGEDIHSSNTTGNRPFGTLSKQEGSMSLAARLAKFREMDEDSNTPIMSSDQTSDIDIETKDFELSFSNQAASGDMIQVLRNRLNNTTTEENNEEELSEEEDPFNDEFDDDDDEGDYIEDAKKSIAVRQNVHVEKLISLLRPDRDDQTVLGACSKLTALFKEQPEQRRALLAHHGVIPILEMLEVSSPEVLHAVLKVVSQMVENDREFQELLSLAGLIPVVAKFCKPSVSHPIRLQASTLVKQFVMTSPVTLQMLVACGGLPMLAELFDSGSANRFSTAQGGITSGLPDVSLSCVAIEGMNRVFALSRTGSEAGAIPKNDFCRLFAKHGVLRRLVVFMQYCRSKQGQAECQVLEIDPEQLVLNTAELILIFSHGDHEVKKYFADHAIVEGILVTLSAESSFLNSSSGKLPTEEIQPIVKVLLKIMKNLSMEPAVLDTLESCGAIPALIPYLAYCTSSKKLIEYQVVKEIQNLVMLSMFYLCRISHSRQEQAAISGIIPQLMDAITTLSPVKTFALQILTDLAHTSSLTRDQLWRWGALDFYLNLLVSGDVFWQEKALSSLGAWIANATPEVERAMLEPKSLQRLVSLFLFAQGSTFQNYVTELLGMLTRSSNLAESIGHSGLFVAELVARLSFPKAEVRIKLLKILKIIVDHYCDLEYIILEHNLYAVVSKLAKQAEDAHRVLVLEIANQLLEDWRTKLNLDN